MEDKLVALGSQLGVSPAALKSLGCGFDQLASAWTFPEKNGQGEITGILRRFETGRKLFVRSGERSLNYYRENLQGQGPIFIVEGASDTAAGITMGLRAIGRPSNTGGKDQLIELLKPILEDDLNCRVSLVGENDLKDNGQWPGRFGVQSISKALARELVCPIEIAMPPQEAKDLLDWRKLCSDEPVDWEKKILSEFSLERVEPSVFIPPTPSDPTVTLDEAREVNLRNMRDNIDKAGVFLSSAATGIGKSTAIQQVITERKLPSLITVRPHQDARSMESGLQKRGVLACAYPQRIIQATTEAVSEKGEVGVTVNCWNGEATEAVTLGLGVSQCVCPSCPFLERCHDSGYLGQVEQTKSADVVVATHARVARLGLDYWRFDGRNGRHFRLHVIEEDAADVLRPCMVIFEDELNCADDFLEVALPFNPEIWESLGIEPDFDTSDLESFFTSFQERAKWLKELLSRVEECREIVVPMPLAVPDDAQRLLFQLIRQSERKELKRPTMVWSLLFALMAGKINLMSVVVASLQGKPGEPKKQRKEIIAVVRTPPCQELTTMILDATVGPKWLEHLVGHGVTRLSPGHVELQTPVVQIPIDITRNFQPQTVRKALRGALLLRPNSQKVGLIVHSNHQEVVEELGPGFGEKIHRISYFHSGEERSDNDWHAECDLILVCGTPRVPPAVIRQKLLQAGLIEAATFPEPEFKEQDWLGTFVDGRRGILTSKRYSDDQWHAAYVEQVHALLRQSVGRGRGLLADGVETFLFSKEPLGYQLLDLKELIQVSDDDRHLGGDSRFKGGIH